MTLKVRALIIFTAGIYFLTACQRKAVPKITERVTEPKQKPIAKNDIKADMERGKVIFSTRCGRCHDLPKPEQYTAQKWDGILSNMIPRARLTDEQGIHVTAYLKANAVK